eukprot:GHVU01130239.1.p1 GENE.GHVU01130239.1~~GHVU01130239.1.p1  ORF type:complete len:153 (+),score=28.45 GHVU01130239.1:499-957(+)
MYVIVEHLHDIEELFFPDVVDRLKQAVNCPVAKALLAQVLLSYYPAEENMIMFRLTAIQVNPDIQQNIIDWLLKKRYSDRDLTESPRRRCLPNAAMPPGFLPGVVSRMLGGGGGGGESSIAAELSRRSPGFFGRRNSGFSDALTPTKRARMD